MSTDTTPSENATPVAQAMRALYNPDLFAGKVVLVTGGSRGIGRAICQAFGALGARVIVNYAGNQEAAQETVNLITAQGGQASCVAFDVAQFTAVQEAVSLLEKEQGPIDILVNNAGISKDGLFVRFSEKDWDSILATNLKGIFNCARAVATGMFKRRQGKIINVSSVVGLTGNGGQTAYAASKAGVLGFTKSLAIELAPRNVQVNALAPGYIATEMTGALSPAVVDAVRAKIPGHNLGEPLDVAKAIVFLASPGASYITGQTLAVDGGMTMY